MTTREKKQQEVKAYLEKTKTIDYNTVPTRGIDSGRGGKTAEMQTKLFLGNYRFNGVSKSKAIDTRKNGFKIEIKTNAGELATLDENGNITDSILKNDYIVYFPEYNANYPVELQAYVLKADTFYNALIESGCIRYKTSTFVSNQAKNGYCEKYHDKITIQNNSIKKLNAIYDICESYGKSLAEWAKENGIRV